MAASEPYNEEVRALFENPFHAGDLQGVYPETLTADVSESEHGARLVLYAGIDDGKIAEIRFRAFACPHLVAAAEAVCREAEGGKLSELRTVKANELMERLSVPVGKTGRMLLIEDAVEKLHAQSGCAG
jgi:nitrogen fixation NifU-like protein